MSIFNGKKISPNTLRFISTLTICLIVISVLFLFTNALINRELSNAMERYHLYNSNILNGYSKAVQYYLESYKTSLASLYNEKLFNTEKPENIQKYLHDKKPYLDSDFYELCYADFKTKKVYFSQGCVTELQTFYTYPFDINSYQWDEFYGEGTLEPSFIIQKVVLDEKNNLIGMLAGSVRLALLQELINSIHIRQTTSIYIQDRHGRFLVHPNPDYIGKTFIPKQDKYKIATSILISSLTSGITETENENGENVDLFFRKIPISGWTICLSNPKNEAKSILRQLNFTKFSILIISLTALLILLFLEMHVINAFYKNQLIDTIYDPLTNLFTRQRFETLAERQMTHDQKSKFMLIESDIRGFKFLNQNYGEQAADKIIIFYGSLLNKIISRYHGIIGRGYADHFFILLKIHNVRTAMSEFHTNLNELTRIAKDYEIPFFPKFGISFVRPSSKRKVSIKELIGQASFSKSTIKDNMILPYAIYNDRLLEKINEEHFIESNMEEALANKEFFVMYQPKILLKNDKVVGAEALVRWKTSSGKFYTPDRFIPLFEKNGFITKLDYYVYDAVFQLIEKRLKNKEPIVPISLNMSRNHNKPEKFMHEFLEIFNKYDIPPEYIQIEIIERSVMDSSTLQEITNRLHQAGFTVAMDDFGSGESSLNMLTKVPVDVLKFDRDFLNSSMNENGRLDEKSAKFIQSLLDLSRNLEKQTVFEGVETEEQRDFLRAAECDQAQGYFYSRPLSENDFIEFIKDRI